MEERREREKAESERVINSEGWGKKVGETDI